MVKSLKNFFALFCLLATSVVTIATSKKTDGNYGVGYNVTPESLARKDYYVASNCPQAISQDRITIEDETIQSPANTNFYNYGLPTNTLNLTFTTQLNAVINGHQRICFRSEQTSSGTPLIVYNCSEFGSYVCQVSFEAVQ